MIPSVLDKIDTFIGRMVRKSYNEYPSAVSVLYHAWTDARDAHDRPLVNLPCSLPCSLRLATMQHCINSECPRCSTSIGEYLVLGLGLGMAGGVSSEATRALSRVHDRAFHYITQ